MRHWRSFSEWVMELAAFSFADKGGQYFIAECLQPIVTPITQVATPEIVNAPLTFIFIMG